MRVAFIQDHLRSGGTENQTIHIADGLAQSGYETHVVVFRKGGALDKLAQSKSFTLTFLNQGLLKTDWFAPGLKKQIDSIAPDVVIAMGRMGNCHAGLLCRSERRYTIIATFRTGRAIPYLNRKALAEANFLVANSYEALRRLERTYDIKREESTVIYNGCIRDFNTSVPSFRNEASVEAPIRLASISMFRPQKMQIRLLHICSKLKTSTPWQLVLAGDGPELQRCKDEAEKLNIADRVEFTGLLKDPKALYYESDIAVHASRAESLPNFLVEAQMAGLPVIAYDVGGVGECFVDGESGFLIDHEDEARFVERLEYLIDSKAVRLQMSEAAREYAEQHFTPQAQLKAYINLLRKLKT